MFRFLSPVPAGLTVFLVALLLAVPLLPAGPASMVPLIVGANGLLFALIVVRRTLRWEQAGPRAVGLFAALFVTSVVVLGFAFPFDPPNPQASISPRFVGFVLGLFFALFSLIVVQRVVGCLGHLLTVVAVVLLLSGTALLLLGWEEYEYFHRDVRPDAQEITLQELLDRGYGNNRHIRLTRFRHCESSIFVRESADGAMVYNLVPVVPRSPDASGEGEPPVPKAVRILVEESGEKAAPWSGGRDHAGSYKRPGREADGYEGILRPATQVLRPEVLARLQGAAPETDPATVLILTDQRPPSGEPYWRFLAVGATLSLLGILLLSLVFRWARSGAAKLAAPPVSATEVVPT